MPLAYQGVQAGHAVAEWMIKNPNQQWNNQTLVYLSVENEDKLADWADKLSRRDEEYVQFVEPDIGNEVTALAVAPTNTKLFNKLKLMGS